MDGVDAPLLEPGNLVEHFEVKKFVGRGGMAEVYLARDSKLGRKVALKLIQPGALGNEDAVARFLFEARVTAQFSHPHIVTIFSVGDHRGHPFLALEYLQGPTLRDRLDKGAVPRDEALRIALAIAEALVEAHRHKVLHRDLKPENVILADDGRLRVVDFGLAKPITFDVLPPEKEPPRASSQVLGLMRPEGIETHDGAIVGTPFYMAPEHWLAMPNAAAADIWALGVILFELVAGRLPFDGQTLLALRAAVCSQEPAPEVAAPGKVPAELATLVRRCLDKLPGGRPSAEEVVTALKGLLVSAVPVEPDAARVPPPRDADGRAVSATGIEVTGKDATPVWGAGRRLALAAAGTVLLAVGGLWAISRARPAAPAHERNGTAETARTTRPRPADDEAAAQRPETARPAEVTITLEGVPDGARVYVDDAAIAGTRTVLRKSSERRELRVEIDGQVRWRSTVRPERDQRLAVELSPPAPSGPAGPRLRPSKRPAAVAGVPSPTAPPAPPPTGPPATNPEPPVDPAFETTFRP